jgi:hypothetical protein
MNRKYLLVVFSFIVFSKCLLASENLSYEYFDNNGLKYNFEKDYKFFYTGDVSRDIEKCEAQDCIFVGKTMLIKPPSEKLTGYQESYNFEGKTIFIKPVKYKILSEEVEGFSVTIMSPLENHTFIYNKERGVIAFELRLESLNYKTGVSFFSSFFLVLSGEKGIFS